MPRGQLEPVLLHLRRVAGLAAVRELTDEQLLERYVLSHDEHAFATLVSPPAAVSIRRRPAMSLYLLNPTAGLMDGDGQLVDLAAGSGTRAVVVSQSATRVHPCLQGLSTQQWQIRVAAGAVLVVLPGPTIPFAGCHYYQRVDISLAADAGLVWGDVWLAGRYARGDTSEQFQFASLIQDLSVRRDDHLVFRDRFRWQGPWDRATDEWHFGTGPACGSLFVTGPVQEQELHTMDSAVMAAFPTAMGDLCVRWSGSSESVTAGVVHNALHLAGGMAGGSMEKPWLPPGHDLGPNHWFSLNRISPRG